MNDIGQRIDQLFIKATHLQIYRDIVECVQMFISSRPSSARAKGGRGPRYARMANVIQETIIMHVN